MQFLHQKSKLLYIFALLVPLAALGQSIDVGSPGENVCTGTPYTTADLKPLASPYNTMRYGPSLGCQLLLPLGTCTITLLMIEPRPPGENLGTQSGLGRRVFSVRVNGGPPSVPIDLYALVGPLKPYRLVLPPLAVTGGPVSIALTASAGNAVLSGLEIACQAAAAAPSLPITVDPDGTVHIHAPKLVLDGTLETGPPGKPTEFTVVQADGTACKLTFAGGKIVLTC